MLCLEIYTAERSTEYGRATDLKYGGRLKDISHKCHENEPADSLFPTKHTEKLRLLSLFNGTIQMTAELGCLTSQSLLLWFPGKLDCPLQVFSLSFIGVTVISRSADGFDLKPKFIMSFQRQEASL